MTLPVHRLRLRPPKTENAPSQSEQKPATKRARPPAETAPSLLRLLSGWRGEVILLSLLLLGFAVFLLGYGVGAHDDTFRTSWVSPLGGTRAAPYAVGSVQGGPPDRGGNTPLLVTVRGLEILPAGERYVLYVRRFDRPTARCGEFTVGTGTTQVHLSYPGLTREPRGWLIARGPATTGGIGQILLRTTRG